MHAFRITARGFHVGAGALLIIGAAQAAERAHKVETVKAGKTFSLVTAKETQAFKTGELVGLSEPPKGQLGMVEEIKSSRKDEPAAAQLLKAVAEFNEAAEQAELKRLMDAEAAENKRAAEVAAAADAVDVAAWTQEFQTLPGVKEKYVEAKAYVAARRAERDKTAA